MTCISVGLPCCLCVILPLFLSLFYLFLVCVRAGAERGKKKNKTIFCPWAIHWKFRLTPAQFDSGEMEFKTKLKVYHRLAVLASDKNDQLERQIWVDSHRGMKIARRIRLPWQFQRSGHHAGRAADAHVHPFIHGSEACHRTNFKGRAGGGGFMQHQSVCMNKQSSDIHTAIYSPYCAWFVLIVNFILH